MKTIKADEQNLVLEQRGAGKSCSFLAFDIILKLGCILPCLAFGAVCTWYTIEAFLSGEIADGLGALFWVVPSGIIAYGAVMWSRQSHRRVEGGTRLTIPRGGTIISEDLSPRSTQEMPKGILVGDGASLLCRRTVTRGKYRTVSDRALMVDPFGEEQDLEGGPLTKDILFRLVQVAAYSRLPIRFEGLVLPRRPTGGLPLAGRLASFVQRSSDKGLFEYHVPASISNVSKGTWTSLLILAAISALAFWAEDGSGMYNTVGAFMGLFVLMLLVSVVVTARVSETLRIDKNHIELIRSGKLVCRREPTELLEMQVFETIPEQNIYTVGIFFSDEVHTLLDFLSLSRDEATRLYVRLDRALKAAGVDPPSGDFGSAFCGGQDPRDRRIRP